MDKFIKCSDSQTIEQLKKLGYQIINEGNGVITFLNDISKPQTFDNNKVIYSSILTM